MELTVVPVTPANRALAEELEVYPDQTGFIETVTQCMQEADDLPAWQPVCLYHKETLIGFSMYGHITEFGTDRVWFDRLLIDRRYQGRGYGAQAVSVLLNRLRTQFPGQDIYLSAYSENSRAIRLYESFGFAFNGELDTGGERVMVLPAAHPLRQLSD